MHRTDHGCSKAPTISTIKKLCLQVREASGSSRNWGYHTSGIKAAFSLRWLSLLLGEKQHWTWDKKQMLSDVLSQLSIKGNNNLHLLGCTQPNGLKTIPKALTDLWWLALSVRGKSGAVKSRSKRKGFKGGWQNMELTSRENHQKKSRK